MSEKYTDTLFEPPEESFEYQLLIGHQRTDGVFKTSEQLRTQYVELTDELVQQMVNGVEVFDPHTGEESLVKPDYVIWLDKSARPVSWLTKELWPVLAADEAGNVPDLPKFRYVNIDREQWVNTIDPNGVGVVDVGSVDKTILRSLRSIFISPKHKKEGLGPNIDTAPTELDGKTVLIVDELRASGKTLDYARDFFKKTFPSTNVLTSHWMGGTTVIGQATGNLDTPIWYNEGPSGRGVDNRDERRSQSSESSTQRLGGWFLSTVHHAPDPKSEQLRREIRQLGKDVRSHKVLVVPASKGRAYDTFDERAERLNGIPFQTFLLERQRLNEDNPFERRSQPR